MGGERDRLGLGGLLQCSCDVVAYTDAEITVRSAEIPELTAVPSF